VSMVRNHEAHEHPRRSAKFFCTKKFVIFGHLRFFVVPARAGRYS
jgi:hypothetical protein